MNLGMIVYRFIKLALLAAGTFFLYTVAVQLLTLNRLIIFIYGG